MKCEQPGCRAPSSTATATSAGCRRPSWPRSRLRRPTRRRHAVCPARLLRHDRRRLLRRVRHARRNSLQRGRGPHPRVSPARPRRPPPRTGSSRPRSAPVAPAPAPRRPAGSGRHGPAPPASVRASRRSRRRPPVDAGQGRADQPLGARGQAQLRQLRCTQWAVRSTASPAGPRGSAPSAARHTSFTPKLKPGDLVARPVPRRRRARPRWARLDLPGARPQRLRPLGRPQGPAQLRRQGRAGRRDRRAAVPRPGRAPEHRRDLQLRHPRRAPATSSWSTSAASRSSGSSRSGCAPHGAYDPLPVDQALAYILEMLPAFQYLHDLGLVYCDFKPDNLIQVGDAVKLIDLGGVRRIDDEESAIYGTVGYQAPEVAESGPSIASDIYTIGRTLVVLTMEFQGYQSTYLSHAARPGGRPRCSSDHDSFYWLRRQVLRRRPGRPVRLGRRAASPRRSGCCARSSPTADRGDEHHVGRLGEFDDAGGLHGAASTGTSCPSLRPDTTDTQYAWLVSLAPGRAQRAARRPAPRRPRRRPRSSSPAAPSTASTATAQRPRSRLAQLLTLDPWDWRALWLQGLAALQSADLAAPRPRSAPSTSRCPASWRPSWRSPWPASGRSG